MHNKLWGAWHRPDHQPGGIPEGVINFRGGPRPCRGFCKYYSHRKRWATRDFRNSSRKAGHRYWPRWSLGFFLALRKHRCYILSSECGFGQISEQKETHHDRRRSILNTEKQTWVTKEVKTKAKGKNRKRHSVVQRKNENRKKRKRINKCPVLSGVLISARCMPSNKVDSAY